LRGPACAVGALVNPGSDSRAQAVIPIELDVKLGSPPWGMLLRCRHFGMSLD
jgi:hypothetical protein